MAPSPDNSIDEQRLRVWAFDEKLGDPHEKRDPDFLRDPAFTDNIVESIRKEVNSAIKQQTKNLLNAVKKAYKEDLDVSELLGADTRRGRAEKIEGQTYEERLFKPRRDLLAASRRLDAIRLRQLNLAGEMEHLKQVDTEEVDWDANETSVSLLRVAKKQYLSYNAM